MAMLFDLRGPTNEVSEVACEFRKIPGVKKVTAGEASGDATPYLVVMRKPETCRATADHAIICLECPFNSSGDTSFWRFVINKRSDLDRIISNLQQAGIEARIKDVSSFSNGVVLTGRQKEILETAISMGYYEFPRRVNVTGLSQVMGIKPPTLSEVLRAAERRVMKRALDSMSKSSIKRARRSNALPGWSPIDEMLAARFD